MEKNAIVSASDAVVGKGVTAVTGLPEQLLALDTVVPKSLFSYALTALILLALRRRRALAGSGLFPCDAVGSDGRPCDPSGSANLLTLRSFDPL